MRTVKTICTVNANAKVNKKRRMRKAINGSIVTHSIYLFYSASLALVLVAIWTKTKIDLQMTS